MQAIPFSAVAADPLKASFAYGSIGYIWSVVHIAQATDAWKAAGLELETIDFPTGRAAMQALLAGSADFATATDTPVVFAALRGLKPVVLASYSRYSLDMKVDGSYRPRHRPQHAGFIEGQEYRDDPRHQRSIHAGSVSQDGRSDDGRHRGHQHEARGSRHRNRDRRNSMASRGPAGPRGLPKNNPKA